MATETIGNAAAAHLCGISPQLFRHRALRGDVRVVRRHPLRVKLSDVLIYAKTMPPVDARYTGRRTGVSKLIKELTTA